MAEQLKGPGRDEALRAIQVAARPGDELAAIVRTRDYARLRDVIRNRPAEHVATMLADLSIEDQVLVFRLLPRKDAAAAFEYLQLDEQERLLKAMAQEDVASLLNEMAPDDRTMFLEELPAPVTRQLLALLTPEERAIASHAARLSRGLDRASDDARLHRRRRALDDPGRARLHPRARAGLRNAQRHLRRRRSGTPDRRHPHPRAAADVAVESRVGPVGPDVRRVEGDRRSGDGRQRVPLARSHGAAGDRHRRRPHRHRHDRRRARCGGGEDDGRHPAHRRFGSAGRTLHADLLPGG
ncbi:MAG: hypothetical protein QM736_02675 [Vicinamibacterales bacterium]